MNKINMAEEEIDRLNRCNWDDDYKDFESWAEYTQIRGNK